MRKLGSRDSTFLDLVEQGLVAHAENLRRLAPVPVHLAKRLLDRGALGLHRCGLRDGGQRAAASVGRRGFFLSGIVYIS